MSVAEPNAVVSALSSEAALALATFEKGGLLLHASAVAANERAYLFLGPSGAGKTTVAMLSPAAVIHDDLVIAQPDRQGEWWLERSPFPLQGSYARYQLKPARLVKAFRLVQSSSLALERLSTAQALSLGLSSTPVLAPERSLHQLLITRWLCLCKAVAFFTLCFRRDDSFWSLIRD